MLNLELIKTLPQPNWALTPFLSRPPTIEEYKKDKSRYQGDVIQNGVYRITASKEACRAWGDDFYLINSSDWWGWVKSGKNGPAPLIQDMSMKIATSNSIWHSSVSNGTIAFYPDSKTWEFTGVFVKNGSVIALDTLHNEALEIV